MLKQDCGTAFASMRLGMSFSAARFLRINTPHRSGYPQSNSRAAVRVALSQRMTLPAELTAFLRSSFPLRTGAVDDVAMFGQVK